MSYTSEFEKVHYPLPLVFDESIESSKVKNTIQRMRGELSELKSEGMDNS
jgi:coiled-coil domain-containing protein 61